MVIVSLSNFGFKERGNKILGRLNTFTLLNYHKYSKNINKTSIIQVQYMF